MREGIIIYGPGSNREVRLLQVSVQQHTPQNRGSREETRPGEISKLKAKDFVLQPTTWPNFLLVTVSTRSVPFGPPCNWVFVRSRGIGREGCGMPRESCVSWSGGRESSPELPEGRRVGEGEDGGGNTTADMQSQHMAKMCSSGGLCVASSLQHASNISQTGSGIKGGRFGRFPHRTSCGIRCLWNGIFPDETCVKS